MEKATILYIGMHPGIRETVVRLINNREGWACSGTEDLEEAKQLFSASKTQLVLLGPGLEAQTEAALRTFCAEQDPDAIVVQHYGGGSGLLYNEIQQALESGKR